MLLSVIIVNYRVPYFLELCLRSVIRTLQGIDAEIIVVDNHSEDGSVDFLRPLFPTVEFIANAENPGFARANNQGARRSAGEYILFLNPDTLVPEDLAQTGLAFIRSAPRAGGVGVRMLDGGGRFLRESSRGLPTPWVAFCKLSGLTALFPRSRRFARYYLGHLPSDRSHPAPVLSGACYLISRAAFEAIGGFDESFFMYAEDIDLSYRLEKAGYTNYYLADTTILHFKGESTRKDLRYIRRFYKAMIQFRRKHFNTGLSRPLRFAIEFAVWLRAGIASLGGLAALGPRTGVRKGGQNSGRTGRRTGDRNSGRAGGRNGGRSGGRTGGRNSGQRPRPRQSWLTGDPAAIRSLEALLEAKANRIPAASEAEAEEIVYCIGEAFTFQSAIRALECGLSKRRDGEKTVAFYVAGGHALVASGGASPIASPDTSPDTSPDASPHAIPDASPIASPNANRQA